MGLFAYKSWFTEDTSIIQNASDRAAIDKEIEKRGGMDPSQFVVMNSDGLFLTAKKGAYLFNKENNSYDKLDSDVDRVEISWDGLILRNNKNDKTFYADPDTGNLNIKGNITIEGNNIEAEFSETKLRFGTYELVKATVNNSECLSFVYYEERGGH